jgi:hypothetical protein
MIIAVFCRVFAFLLPDDDVGFGPSSGLFVFDPLLKSGLRAAILLASCQDATSVVGRLCSLIPGLGVNPSNDHPCRAHCSLRGRGGPSA